MQPATDDYYVLDAYLAEQQHLQQTLYHQQQQFYQQQQQQQHQQHQQHQHQHQLQSQRRAYGYQNYAAAAPSIAGYVAPWELQQISYLDAYSALPAFDPYAPPTPVDFGPYPATVHPSQLMMNPQGASSCSDSTLYSSYVSQTQHQHAQQQHIPTCIAPEDVFSPLTPLSDPESGSSDGTSSPSSTTRHNSPTRLGLSIPTVSLVHPIANASWANLTPSLNTSVASGPSSTLSSPVESLSSHASSSDNDNEPSFVPPPSLKKSSASLGKSNKRATRSAAPEPAWVEAILASTEVKKTEEVASAPSQVGPVRVANRPIAFACVFCRHRKIQCIRPKTEVAPGEKPPPCKGAAAANTLQLPSTPVVRSDEQPRIREVVRPSPRRVNFAFLVLRASSPHHSIVVTVVLSSSNPSSAGQHQLSLFVDNNYTIGFTAPVYNPTLHIAHSDVRAQPGASFLSFYGPESRTISTLWSYIQTLQTLQTQSPELSNPQFPAPLPA
ncbi:SubName: Full=Uncharacterized protein {ECO:0000313/EMBL:CCA72029.1} [Serendipita indica DSM 11827]|nr:SubName: Full=Uncharacterized protein {ECO:0000313/EMBL:CCA72029.1} [Serendipita indica DSM 11827]